MRSMLVKLIVPELPSLIVLATKSTTTALVALLELDRVGARAAVDHIRPAGAAREDEIVAAKAADRRCR